jgi:hypothetical protein
VHTVVETELFIRSAKDAGVTQDEIDSIKLFLAVTPDAGDEISGTGGARKVRFAARGKGKSGGYRVITFYSGLDIPVFLLDIYAKGDQIDLTQSDKNMMKKGLRILVETCRSKENE